MGTPGIDMPNDQDPQRPNPFLAPYASANQALARAIAAQFGTGQRLRRFKPGFIPTRVSALAAAGQEILHGLFSGFTDKPTSEQVTVPSRTEVQDVGQPAPGTSIIDVTDPSVGIGDTKLNSHEQFIRGLRYLARAAVGSTETGLPTSVGIQRMLQAGELAPPSNKEEQLALFMAPLLASLGVFAPLAGGGAAAQALTKGKTALTSAQQLRAAAPLFHGTAEDVAFNSSIGALMGGMEVAGAKELGADISPGQAALGIVVGGAIGAGIPLALRGATRLWRGTPMDQVQAAQRMEFQQGPLEVPPGAIVGNRRAIINSRTGRLQWQYTEGEKKGDFVSKSNYPTEAEFRAWGRGQLDAARLKIDQDAAAVPEGAKPTPANPESVPADLQPRIQEMQTIGAKYWGDQGARRLARRHPEELARELENTRRFMLNTDVPEDTRIVAGGRVMALERALGISETPPNLLPFDVEAEVIETVRKFKAKFGSRYVERMAGRVAQLEGRPEVAQRMLEVLKAPEIDAQHGEILRRLTNISKQTNRGIRRGQQVIWQGQAVTVSSKPFLGQARAYDFAGEEHLLDLAQVMPVPVAGKTVKATDGRVGFVVDVAPAKGTAGVRFPGEDKVTTIQLGEIAEVGLDQATANSHLMNKQVLDELVDISDASDVPPITAVTPEGERVVIEQVGSEGVTVRVGGKTKRMKRDQIRRSTSTKPEPGERTVVDFAPGTLPDAAHRILFASLPRNQAAAIEAAHVQGALTPDNLPGKLAHVLPPHAAREDRVLYALEIPSELLTKQQYHELSNAAVAALGPKSRKTLDHYLSPVDLTPEAVQAARLYRVSDGLHAAAQRSEAAFSAMSLNEQRAYLRHLIAFNEQPRTPVAKAAKKARAAHEKAATAQLANDGEGVLRAETQKVEAQLEALEEVADLDALTADHYDGLVNDIATATQDPQLPARKQWAEQGLVNDETRALWQETVEKLPASTSEAAEVEVLVLQNAEQDGLRLFVAKELQPAVARSETGIVTPTTRAVYRVQPVSPNGDVIEEGIRTFDDIAGLNQYIQEQKFIPSPTKLLNVHYRHRQDSGLTLTLRQADQGEVSAITEAPVVGEQVTAEQQLLDEVEQFAGLDPNKPLEGVVGELQEEAASGMLFVRERAVKKFKDLTEARAWADAQGYDLSMEDFSFTTRFNQLPSIEDLGDASVPLLRQVNNDLSDMIEDMAQLQRRVSPAAQEYAEQFIEIYNVRTGSPALSRDARELVKIPDWSDIGPQPVRGINYSEMAQLSEEGRRLLKRPVRGREEGATAQMRVTRVESGAPPEVLSMYDVQRVRTRPSSKPLRALVEQKKLENEQTRWTAAFMKLQEHGDAPMPTRVNSIVMGRYAPTGQSIEVVDVKLSEPQVQIKFPGSGEILTVAKEDVILGHGQRIGYTAEAQEYALAESINSGRYYENFTIEPSQLGFGKVEQKLGVLGADRKTVIQAMANRANELAQELTIAGESIDIHPESAQELLDIYSRAFDFDIEPTAVFTPALKPPGKVRPPPEVMAIGRSMISEDIINMVRAVDPKLVAPFKFAAFQRARQTMGDTPAGDLYALAKSGWLTKEQKSALLDVAEDIGLSTRTLPSGERVPSLPWPRVVKEILTRRKFNPVAANFAIKMNRESGFIRWGQEARLGPEIIEVRIPRTGDIGPVEAGGAIPWKLMRKFPTARLFDDAIYWAQEQELRFMHSGRAFLDDLRDHRYSIKDRRAMRNLIESHDTWEEALAAGASERFQYGFHAYQTLFDEGWDHILRNFLRRKIQPVKFLGAGPRPSDAAKAAAWEQHRNWIGSRGIDPDTLVPEALVMPRMPDDVRKASSLSRGEEPSGWSPDKIEEFIRAYHEYPDAAALPADAPEEFKAVFDFWKRFRRLRYWPLVHEGDIGVIAVRGDEEKVMAWTNTGYDAMVAVQELVRQGRISVADKIRIKQLREVPDDIVVQTIPGREYRKFAREAEEHMELGPEDIQWLLTRTDFEKQPLNIFPPGQVHAKPRTRGLRPLFDDPDREVMVYVGRIARQDYRWNILQATRLLDDSQLDNALSTSHGTPKLPHNVRTYALDRAHRALGELTPMDRFFDYIVAAYEWLGNAPREQIANIFRGKAALPSEEIWKLRNYLRPYAARTAASRMVAGQSLFRLGFSPISAVSNLFQYMTTTLTDMVAQGIPMTEAIPLWTSSWVDAARIWAHQVNPKHISLPKHLQDILPIIEESGIGLAPGKFLAGAGRSWGDLTGTRIPLYGKSLTEKAEAIAHYAGMFMFNGAERINRFGTALIYIKRIMAQTGDVQQAIAGASDAVRRTQFLYDELSMPLAMQKLGPLGRVLFQFKPFMFNIISFEKDLIVKAAKGDRNAAKALGVHFGGLLAFGGVVGLLHNPVFSALGGVIKAATGEDTIDILGQEVPLTTGAAQQRARARRQRRIAESDPLAAMSGEWRGSAMDDLVTYGIPGLAHLSMGQRIGVSGQDLTMMFDSPSLLGPQVGPYWEVMNLWRGWWQQRHGGFTTPGFVGGVVGAVAPSFIPGEAGQFVRKSALAQALHTRSITGILGASLFSAGSKNPFGEYWRTSDQGRAVLARAMPSEVRNIQNMIRIFSEGVTRDIDGRPAHIAPRNRTEEAIYAGIGAPTIRRDEYNAATGILTGSAAIYSATRKSFVERAARAWAAQDYSEAYEILQRAQEMGIYISESSIQREMESITREKLETIRSQSPVQTRFPE